ncbi:endonuclease-reverse transcriptase [Elysia marginata]|uniref:Endonuclease-reverse transcriptase n=1 Tax=Elysia marginata TaxID=1093978 RepID=A0AAV4H6J6_9GAST|nr:endonuclease-reverse transcriptase [Elysia marginata]
MESILDENQPRDQAGFRKAFSTTEHMHTLSQIIEKSNEYNLQLCLGFIDYEKAFDSVEHFAILDALQKININENYIQILENIYKNATARIHIDNLRSEPFPINRGVRQGDPISPKLFIAAIEEILKKSELSNGINIDGEILTNLRFADDVALLTESTPLMEEHLNTLNIKSKEALPVPLAGSQASGASNWNCDGDRPGDIPTSPSSPGLRGKELLGAEELFAVGYCDNVCLMAFENPLKLND